MKQMGTIHAYEDNAGGVNVIRFAADSDTPLQIFAHLELSDEADDPSAIQEFMVGEGWGTNLEPYNPADFGGLTLEEAAEDIQTDSELVAEYDGFRLRYFPDVMGAAASKLFPRILYYAVTTKENDCAWDDDGSYIREEAFELARQHIKNGDHDVGVAVIDETDGFCVYSYPQESVV